MEAWTEFSSPCLWLCECVRTWVSNRLSLCLCMYMCMHESVSRSEWSLCILVCMCVPMWFLARASTEIGLPAGAVCRESGKAEGKLNNSTFLKLEWGVWRWVLLNLAPWKNEVKQKWSRLSCIFVGLYLSNCKKQNLGFKINLRFLMWQWSWLQLNPCVSGLSNESI